MPHLSIREVTKSFRGQEVLHKLSLELGDGMTGLLGPNGSGKSTLLRILATTLRPSEGAIELEGLNPRTNLRAYRGMVAFMPQSFELHPSLTPLDFLNLMSVLRGVTRREAYAHRSRAWRMRSTSPRCSRKAGSPSCRAARSSGSRSPRRSSDTQD